MGVVDALNAVAGHISSVMLITGFMQLAVVSIRKWKLLETHPIKKYGDPALSVALLPMGTIQLYTMLAYILALLLGDRVPLDLWGQLGTLAYIAAMGVGGFSSVSQVGRKVPWAVLIGLGTASIGGGSIYQWATGLGFVSNWVLAGSVLAGLGLYVSAFLMAQPWSELIEKMGNASAYSPPMIANSLALIILGVISGMGVVVL